jgi:hypothetical protein
VFYSITAWPIRAGSCQRTRRVQSGRRHLRSSQGSHYLHTAMAGHFSQSSGHASKLDTAKVKTGSHAHSKENVVTSYFSMRQTLSF